MGLFVRRFTCVHNLPMNSLFNIVKWHLFKLHAFLVVQIIISSMTFMLLHFFDQDYRLWDKHHNGADECQNKEKNAQTLLHTSTADDW